MAVAADAPSPLVNTASAAGGGATDATGSVSVDTAIAPDLTLTLSATSAFVRGQAASYAVRVTNSGGLATSAAVSVVHTLPAGLTVAALSGTGWTCDAAALTCTRADALASGQSYPDIALTVIVAADAASNLTTTAVVSGGGETNTANNTATHGAAAEQGGSPDLTLSKAAAGTFVRGEPGLYVLGVRNVGSAPSAGTITVTDTVPAALTPESASGTGWACSIAGQAVSCTRSDALAPGASFPDIMLTAGVDPFAPDSVTNTASVSGGGDTTPANNTASAHTAMGGVLPSPELDLTVREANSLVQGGTGERGVAGVRVLLATGQSVTTDSRGMYSFPVIAAGTTAVAVDPSTVPTGYALSKGGALHEGPSRLMRTPLGGFGMLRQNFPLTRVAGTGDFADGGAGPDAADSAAAGPRAAQSGAMSAQSAFTQPASNGAPPMADGSDRARPGAPAAAGVPWNRAGATQAANVASFEIQPERTVLSADGRDRTEVRIRALDANRLPVVGGYVTLSTTAGYLWVPRDRVATPDAMANGLEAPSWQAAGRLARTGPPSIEGRHEAGVCAFVEPEPGTEASDLYRRTSIDLSQGDRVCLVADVHPGLAVIRAHQGVAGDAAGEAIVELTVPARAPMVVAIGEVVVSQRAPEVTGESATGRVQRMGSFFFQDSFGDNGRITLAATSTPSINSATGAERMFQRDPLDRIYPVLGDGSTRLELTQSNSRVYARADLGGSHVMFGDIRGDVSDGRSRLIDFQRSLTGVRAHLANGGDGWISLVVSSPDTAFTRDVFPGSAGAYLRLNRSPVVAGSEIVTLEVRDRRNPERVLSREPLVRSADYHLDPLTGVVYLLRPLPALTSALDLVQVVVAYESRSNGPGSDVILARSNQRIDALGLDIRASALRQGTGLGGLTVGGVELNQRMPANGQLRVELPVSQSTADTLGGPNGTGFATRIDLSQPLGHPGAFLRGRFVRTDRDFDNPYGQQVVPGQTSGEASFELAPFAGTQLRAIVGHEANETALVDNARSTAGAEWTQRMGEQLRLSGAFTARRLVDDLVDRRVSSQMASAGVEWRLGSRIEALLRREQNLSRQADPTYPTQTVLGGKYQVTRLHSIFATQRLSGAPIVPTSDTSAAGIFTPLTTRELAVGVESRVAQHTSVLSRYRREGAGETTDAFAVIGVLSRLPVSRMFSIDGGFDHAHHLEGTGRSYSSASTGLTFMPHDEMRASWFYQLRMREERQHVLWTGVTGRMLPWLTGLGQYRWLRAEGRAPVEGDQLLGALAVRPVESDRVGLLLSYEHGDFENALVSGPRRRTGRLSTDGFYQPAERLELYTRLARIDTPGLATVAPERTYVWQGRAQFRILSRIDVASEARHLSPMRGAGLWIAAGETGIWISRDLRIGLGYASRPMIEPGHAVTIASGRAGAYIVFSTRLASLFDLGERFGR